MFASRTVAQHLVRGAVGFGGLVLAMMLVAHHPVWALLAGAGGVVALRGCPMCWTIGLLQTVMARLRGQSATAACIDGSCAVKRHVRA
jgi:hypothetical protein